MCPDILMLTLVFPQFKLGDKSLLKKYNCESNLSGISTSTKIVNYDTLTDFTDSHNIISMRLQEKHFNIKRRFIYN